MSLDPVLYYAMPEDTARVARDAFPKGNVYLRMHDALGPLYHNPSFAALFSARGRPAEAPARLALITIMQFAENLSDRQAADAVRGRIDWKYALSLELDDPGFDASVLCEFRARLLTGDAEQLLLDTLLAVCREQGLLRARGRQRTDSTHVLAAIHALNRLECVGETLRHALNSLAVARPGLAARPRGGGLGGALRPARAELPPAQGRRRAPGAGDGDGRRRLRPAHGALCARCPGLAARGPCRRDPAPGVGAAVPRRGGGCPLARDRRAPPGGGAHQLPV